MQILFSAASIQLHPLYTYSEWFRSAKERVWLGLSSSAGRRCRARMVVGAWPERVRVFLLALGLLRFLSDDDECGNGTMPCHVNQSGQ